MIYMLFKDLKINPLRSFLTAFSMLIGILAVIAAVLIGTVGKDYLQATNEQLYGRTPTLTIPLSKGNFSDHTFLTSLTDRLSNIKTPVAVVLSQEQDIIFSIPTANKDSLLFQQEILTKSINMDTVYTTAKYRDIYNLPLVKGQWFQDENKATRLEMVINKPAYGILKNAPMVYALEKNTITPTPINIVGVVNDGLDTAKAYINIIPLSLFAKDLLETNSAELLWLNYGGYSYKNILSYLTDIFTDIGNVEVGQIQEDRGAENYATVLAVLQLGFTITSLLLLFVSAVGLINIGLASLEERTHELVIRRALGANRKSIAQLVLGGAVLLSTIVAVFAILLSILLVILIGEILPSDSPVSPPQYPYLAAVIAITASTLTAFIGGIFPALKASRLEPALALR